MLRQFILAIFLIALALPATAMPVPSVESVTGEDCHGMPKQDNDTDHKSADTRLHGCIGCIAPFADAYAAMAAQQPGFVPYAEPVRCLTGTTPRPSLPPPRS